MLPPLPKKLILFIEADSEQTNMIRHYMQTGDISKWLSWWISLETNFSGIAESGLTDNYEYFRNLKRIEERVQKLNIQDISHPYDFQIMGPEGYRLYDCYKKTYDSTVMRERYRQFEKARFEYFVLQRDEISSSNIQKALDTNLSYKALIFYGAGHLLRGRQNKARWPIAPKGIHTAYGYFMAHYLDQYFSRDSISIFYTENYPRESYSGILEYERNTIAPDYSIYCKPIPPAQCPFEIIKCKTTLRLLFEGMKKYGLGSSEEEQIYSSTYAIRLVFQLKRSYLHSYPEVRPWLDSLQLYAHDTSRAAKKKRVELADKLIKDFDAIKNINSLDEWIALPLKDKSYYLPILKMVLINMPSQGIPFLEYSQFDNLSLNEHSKKIILSRKEDLIDYFLINLLWIGTPIEKNRAKKELTSRTGLKLITEEEWSAWWRTKYNDPQRGVY